MAHRTCKSTPDGTSTPNHCGRRTHMPILVYEYLITSPRIRGLGNEVRHDGQSPEGRQPARAVAAHVADGTADVPVRDGRGAAAPGQGPVHQDQLGFALYRGAEPG